MRQPRTEVLIRRASRLLKVRGPEVAVRYLEAVTRHPLFTDAAIDHAREAEARQ
jgi:hypothetical protein